MDLVISPLGEVHDRKSFDCGEQSLNQYLRQHANQVIKRRINKVFVASRPETPQQVVGYYSLSAFSLDVNDLPEKSRKGPPRYPVPAVLLGQFAVAEFHQGKGFGSFLFTDALKRISRASQAMAVYAVVVDALNDRAAEFYQRRDFTPMPDWPLKLFLAI